MLVDHVERRVQPIFPELDDDLAFTGNDVDGRDHAVESRRRHVQLVASRRSVFGDDRRSADVLPIDEHLRARHVAVDAECSDIGRHDRRRRLDSRGGGDRWRHGWGRRFRSDRLRVRRARCWSGRRCGSGGNHCRLFGLRRLHPHDDDRGGGSEPCRSQGDNSDLPIHATILSQRAFVHCQIGR